jgi:hypothetical protein
MRRAAPRFRALVFAALAAAAALAAPAPAPAQEVVARVATVQGAAYVAREAARLVAEAGLEVQRRDELTTAGDGRMRLNFRDGTVVAIGPNSRVLVLHYLDTLGGADSRTPLLELFVGILRATVPDVGSLGWTLETRAAVASSRSTDWIVEAGEVEGTPNTAVIVLGGVVRVADRQGGTLNLTGGEGVDVRLGEPIPDEPTRWGAGRVIDFVERTALE